MAGDPRADVVFDTAQALLDQLDAAIRNKDVAAQLLIRIKLSRLTTDLKRIETGHRLILGNVMRIAQLATDPQERKEKLLNAFKVAARIRGTAQDDLVDDNLAAEAEAQLKVIVSGLDALPPDGRAALVPLLAVYNMDLRASAAVALYDVMPERVAPILRDLAEKEMGASAGTLAMAALATPEP